MLLVGGLSAALAGGAAAQAPTQLSLADAIRLAEENSPTFRQWLNNRNPADWGVRSAYAQLLPSASVNGSMGYTGAGSQTFLTTTFQQSSSTISSSYSALLNWSISGAKLTEPGLRKAERDAVDADIDGARVALQTAVTQAYLAVLEARSGEELAELQVTRNEEFLRLAQARFDVGQTTLIDVRRAQVAKGQADVALLREQVGARVAVLQLYQTIGVVAPDGYEEAVLTDSFPVVAPEWSLDELLALAEERNPSLISLRERSEAAQWAERSARSQYLPTLSLSAGWSGFTQEFTNPDPLVDNALAQASNEAANNTAICNYQNDVNARLVDPLPPFDCSGLAFTPAQAAALEQQLRSRNDQFPFSFTRQPFSARLTLSLPIFIGFSRPLQVSQARAQLENARLTLRDQGLAVRTGVAQRFLEVETAFIAIAIEDTNQVAAAEGLQLATERYRVGSGTFYELLDAQFAALQADASYIAAVYAYHRAVADLEAAVGRVLR
jgi:outer membrane protein